MGAFDLFGLLFGAFSAQWSCNTGGLLSFGAAVLHGLELSPSFGVGPNQRAW